MSPSVQIEAETALVMGCLPLTWWAQTKKEEHVEGGMDLPGEHLYTTRLFNPVAISANII